MTLAGSRRIHRQKDLFGMTHVSSGRFSHLRRHLSQSQSLYYAHGRSPLHCLQKVEMESEASSTLSRM
jgi:hypothetical protein